MKLNESSGRNRYERKKEETRQKIINVAMDLFNKQSFDLTTLEQVAEEADIARKTLYNHFPNKEEIVCEFFHRFMKEREPEIYRLINEYSDTRSQLIAVLNKTMEWVKKTKVFYEIFVFYRLSLVKASTNQIQRSSIHNFLEKIIGLGRESGEIRQGLPMEILVSQVDNIRFIVVMGWLKDPENFPVQDCIAKGVDLFLYGAMNGVVQND